jgi:NAD(P) transhydrogenase subunit alpha
MKLAVPKEVAKGETRVALAPESVKKLTAAGFTISIEKGAGEAAYFADAAYTAAGATVVADPAALISGADMLLKVRPPTIGEDGRNEVEWLRPGAMVLTGLMPARNLDVVRALATRGVTSFSTDAIPRTTRAQAMDTLSSMANIAGYRGAQWAAVELNRYCPMLMTAAGTILPAKFFVIGAGVAGLQAIATAKRMGAQVWATDVRPEVKEQIESVGAKYVGIELKESAQAGGGYAKELSAEDKARQQEMLVAQCIISDAVITTALIGGVFAPRLITADMVRKMKPGSVVVDLAAEGGGNCELSQPGKTVIENGVKIVAPLNIPSTMSTDASTLWSRNLLNFLMAFWKDKAFNLDLNDEILKGAIVTHKGEIMHAKTRELLGAAKSDAAQPVVTTAARAVATPLVMAAGIATAAMSALDARADDAARTLASQGADKLDLVSMMFVFMLATFIGIGVIRRVSRLLHTPLMSLTNAISAIAVVGSIMVAGGEGYPTHIRVMGAVALFASMTNIISGFMITDRMLRMFKSGGEGRA